VRWRLQQVLGESVNSKKKKEKKIRVLVSHQNASKREKRSEGERKKERRNSRRIYTHAH